jgi:hypothetical protein
MIEPKRCENCGEPITPNLQGPRSWRFCCRRCSDEWFAAERKQAVEWFRREGLAVETERKRAQG